jgi:hypothetical protein
MILNLTAPAYEVMMLASNPVQQLLSHLITLWCVRVCSNPTRLTALYNCDPMQSYTLVAFSSHPLNRFLDQHLPVDQLPPPTPHAAVKNTQQHTLSQLSAALVCNSSKTPHLKRFLLKRLPSTQTPVYTSLC